MCTCNSILDLGLQLGASFDLKPLNINDGSFQYKLTRTVKIDNAN